MYSYFTCLKSQPPHLLYVAQSGSTLCSKGFIILINLPYPCDAKTFTISISHVSPFIAFGTNIVNPSILAIPSTSKPLSIISTV